VILSIII